MPITHLSHAGKRWPVTATEQEPKDFVQACLDGDCNYPAPIAATIIKNMGKYDNRGTVSGSQLGADCDFRRVAERVLDLTVEVSTLFYASFRGSNVHQTIEAIRDDPRFNAWVFEERFFAALAPDDRIFPLTVPTETDSDPLDGREDVPDWTLFAKMCEHLVSTGHVILSGAIDTADKRSMTQHDWKTANWIGAWTDVKPDWLAQQNLYTLLANLNGLPLVDRKITVMDASDVLVLDVPEVDMVEWVRGYLIPRVRVLEQHKRLTVADVLPVTKPDFKDQWPEKLPLPVTGYLCEGKDKRGYDSKIYCSVRINGVCPAWTPEKTAAFEAAHQAKMKAEKDMKAAAKKAAKATGGDAA